MKINNLKAAAAIGLSAMLVGSAAAQESVSAPVGYETITIDQTFNYMGLRLVGAPLATSAVATSDAGVITLDGATLADGDVLLEVNVSDDAIVGSVVEATVAGGGIAIPAELAAQLAVGDSVTVRELQTLASIFGDPVDGLTDPTAGLNGGPNSGAADLVLIPDGADGFITYFYNSGGFGGAGAGWQQLNVVDNTSTPVADASAIALPYTDGIVIQNRGDNNQVVVSGSVATTVATPPLTGTFSYLSTVFPAGSTLSTMFDDPANPGNLREDGTISGAPNSGAADLVLVPDGAGFRTFFFNSGGFGGAGAGWRELDVSDNTDSVVDSTTISFEDVSSIIIQNRGEDRNISLTPPSFYSEL